MSLQTTTGRNCQLKFYSAAVGHLSLYNLPHCSLLTAAQSAKVLKCCPFCSKLIILSLLINIWEPPSTMLKNKTHGFTFYKTLSYPAFSRAVYAHMCERSFLLCQRFKTPYCNNVKKKGVGCIISRLAAIHTHL